MDAFYGVIYGAISLYSQINEVFKMLSALFSFLGGSVFRMIWGEVSTWVTAKQDHQHEIEKMRLQSDIDQKTHAQNLESMRVQSELGLKEVVVKSEQAINEIDAQGFYAAQSEAMKPTGVKFVDCWNGSIRPAAATIALCLWTLALHRNGWTMIAWDMDLIASIFGFFFADRSMAKRGK